MIRRVWGLGDFLKNSASWFALIVAGLVIIAGLPIHLANAVQPQLPIAISGLEYQSLLPKTAPWSGITVGVGMSHDPYAMDAVQVSNLKTAATAALSKGKRLTVRMNDHVFNWSKWMALAGITSVESIYYPASGPNNIVWTQMGWQYGQYAKILAAICDSLGVPRDRVTLELSNEADIGGVTGPYVGSYSSVKSHIVNAYSLYAQYKAGTASYATFLAEWIKGIPQWVLNADGSPPAWGTVPERFFDRMIIEAKVWNPLSFGFRIVGSTLESAGNVVNGVATSDFAVELKSWENPKAQTFRSYFNQINFNHYARYAGSLTPAQVANEFVSRAIAKQGVLAKHITLSGLPVGITEFNISITNGNGLSTVAAFRQALVDMIPTIPNLNEASIFTSIEHNTADGGMGLYTMDATTGVLTPVGGVEVYPKTSAVDSIAPSVQITNPTDGAPVSGVINVSVSGADNVGVSSLALYLDGILAGSSNASFGQFAIDSTTLTNGVHTLQARASDAAGNIGLSSVVSINVGNFISTSDTTPPSVQITTPVSGFVASGSMHVQANATDNVGVASVVLVLDGVQLPAVEHYAPYDFTIDTTKLTNGAHQLVAMANDAALNQGMSAPLSFSVSNGTTSAATVVTILTPKNGSFVTTTSSVAISATVSPAVPKITLDINGQRYMTSTGTGLNQINTSHLFKKSGQPYQIVISAYDSNGKVVGSAVSNVTAK